MIEKSVSLALSIEANPQVFALLLGSGTSRSAEIPTGWEVQLELIRRVATLSGEDTKGDPASWYRTKFGGEPDYSKLLEMLAPSPSERQGLLQSFFEAKEEDREANRKVPQAAHKAIASLVKAGFVRVIITTNFDRLVEQALEAEGIVPTVISTVDALKGAKPYAHTQCTIVKVHGDYLDTQFRNTESELTAYPSEFEAYLERLFTEHSLIICGWSATWDHALRAVLTRGTTQRYSTYWTTVGEPSEQAKALIQHRNAQVIQIKDADSFFTNLNQNVLSAQALKRPHPLSVEMAKVTLKRLLTTPIKRIELHDLILSEGERTYAETTGEQFSPSGPHPTAEELRKRAQAYESNTEILRAIFAIGSYWASGDQLAPFLKVMDRMTRFPVTGGFDLWNNMKYYPALLLLYSIGISAIVSGNFALLKEIVMKIRFRDINEEPSPLIEKVNPGGVFGDGGKLLPGQERNYTPVNNHLFTVLANQFTGLILGHDAYERAFNQWEYLFDLIYVDQENSEEITPDTKVWAPPGRFRWKYSRGFRSRSGNTEQSYFAATFREDADDFKKAILAAGFFSGKSQRFDSVKAGLEKFLPLLRFDW